MVIYIKIKNIILNIKYLLKYFIYKKLKLEKNKIFIKKYKFLI